MDTWYTISSVCNIKEPHCNKDTKDVLFFKSVWHLIKWRKRNYHYTAVTVIPVTVMHCVAHIPQLISPEFSELSMWQCPSKYTQASSSYSEPLSNPVRSASASGACPCSSAHSKKAMWQNTYCSGIWMLNARCARIASTVDLKFTHLLRWDSVDNSIKTDWILFYLLWMRVMESCKNMYTWCPPCPHPRIFWWRCRLSWKFRCARFPLSNAQPSGAPSGDQTTDPLWLASMSFRPVLHEPGLKLFVRQLEFN